MGLDCLINSLLDGNPMISFVAEILLLSPTCGNTQSLQFIIGTHDRIKSVPNDDRRCTVLDSTRVSNCGLVSCNPKSNARFIERMCQIDPFPRFWCDAVPYSLEDCSIVY